MDGTDRLAIAQNPYVSNVNSSPDGLLQLSELRFKWEGDPVKIATEVINLYGETLVVLRNAYDDKFTLLRYFPIGTDWRVSNDSSNANAEEALDWLNNPRVL